MLRFSEGSFKRLKQGKWVGKKTAKEGTFISVVDGEYTFSITKFDYADNETRIAFWMTDNENEEVLRIAASYDHPYKPHSQELSDLYNSARSLALDIKRKLREAANILDRI